MMFWGEILICVLNSLASSIRSYNNVFVVNLGKKCFSFPGQKKIAFRMQNPPTSLTFSS